MAKSRKAKVALDPSTYGSVMANIKKLGQHQLRLAREPFSMADLACMFLPNKATRALLHEAFIISATRGSVYELKTSRVFAATVHGAGGDLASFTFSWGAGVMDGFYPMAGGIEGMAEDCPVDLVDRWFHVQETLYDVSYRFGKAIWVFEQLQDLLPSPGHLRYIWPCILPLLKMSSQLQMAEELQKVPPQVGQRAMTAVPSSVFIALKDTSDTIMRALMLDPGMRPVPLPVEYRINLSRFGNPMFTGLVLD